MSMKYGLLSFLALCVCLFTLLKSYEVWTQPLGEVSENRVERRLVEEPKAPPTAEPLKKPNPVGSPIVIAGKNVFSPERKDFPVVPVEQSRQMVRPQVVLYGVTIAGDYQSASLVHPGRPLRKGERETVTLRLGEQISGYNLATVSPDRIRLERAGDSFEVLLYDSKSPKKRTDPKPENRQAGVAPPGTRVGISGLPGERAVPQATPANPQGSTSVTSAPGSSASMFTPTAGSPPTKVTPTQPTPTQQAIQLLRERARRGRAMAPPAPTNSAPGK